MHVLVGLAVLAMIGLGVWQFRVALPVRTAADPNAVPVPLNDVSTFGDFLAPANIGVVVGAQGRYDASKQTVATVAPGPGAPVVPTRFAVLTPLILGDGTAVAVLRGGVNDSGAASAPNAGEVRVVGPITNESLNLRIPTPSAASGQSVSRPLSTAALLAAWKLNLRDGVVVLSDQQPSASAGRVSQSPTSVALAPPDPSVVVLTTDAGLQWRNALYSVQWMVFALFATYLYVRYLLDTLAGNSDRIAPTSPPPSA